MEFVGKSNAASLLAHVKHGAASFTLDHLHSRVELRPAVAPLTAEDIAGEALRMDAHQDASPAGDITLDESQMLKPSHSTTVHLEPKMPVVRRQIDFLDQIDKPVVAAAVRN